MSWLGDILERWRGTRLARAVNRERASLQYADHLERALDRSTAECCEHLRRLRESERERQTLEARCAELTEENKTLAARNFAAREELEAIRKAGAI